MRKANGAHVWVVELDQRAGRGWEPLCHETFPTREACRSAAMWARKHCPKEHYRAALYVRASADAHRQAVKR
jgi:hypothetical protein